MCKRFRKASVIGILAGVMGATLLLSSPVRADSFSVNFAYADNLRPSGFFPTPWLGAPNVVSQSPANQTFDSGAISINNTGTNSITITNLTVTLTDFGAFSIWNPLTLGPGQIGIFAQNNGVDTQFDTSDYGVFGSSPPTNLEPNNADHNGNTNLIGGCSSPVSFMTASQQTLCSAIAPVVSFDENGNPVTVIDSGNILDTGGWDFIYNSAFGEDGNESINWNNVGGTSRGGTSVPEPQTSTLIGIGLLLLAGAGMTARRSA